MRLHSDLHDHVLSGDPEAFNVCAEWALRVLPRSLQHGFPRAPTDALSETVEDAVLEYFDRPQRFDPRRSVSLEHYLRMAARRNVLNMLQREARRQSHETEFLARTLSSQRATQPDSTALDITRFAMLLAHDPKERAAVAVWLDGVVETPPLAKALGMHGLTPAMQRREVKRFKDRVIKRAMRLLPQSQEARTAEVELRPRVRNTKIEDLLTAEERRSR